MPKKSRRFRLLKFPPRQRPSVAEPGGVHDALIDETIASLRELREIRPETLDYVRDVVVAVVLASRAERGRR